MTEERQPQNNRSTFESSKKIDHTDSQYLILERYDSIVSIHLSIYQGGESSSREHPAMNHRLVLVLLADEYLIDSIQKKLIKDSN